MDLGIKHKVALAAASSKGLGKAVAFLASEGADYITGVSLQVDGGYIKGWY